MVKPEKFRITLEKPIYFPGEIIKGSLYIANSKEIKCRGVRVHLQGKGHCRFGDDDGICTHTQFYTNCKRTFYGNVNKTPVIHEAGANAIFGPPWAPDEGVLFVNLRADQQYLVLQAMDYEWLKKDKILGEVLVDINQCIGLGQMELRLMKKGRMELGAIYFQMDWDTSRESNEVLVDAFGQPLRCLRVQIFRVLGLRDKEWFGKNDIYIRIYTIPDGVNVDLTQALPKPVIDIVLPPGEMTIPFSFQLPTDLPSSMVLSKDNYIVYSMYAYIDVAWRMDPSTRTFFTVMQPNPSSYFMQPLQQYAGKLIYKQCFLAPLCCGNTCNLECLPANGNLRVIATTDRAAYAPGEEITLSLEISSSWQEALEHISSVNVFLQQHVHLWADDKEVYQSIIVGPQFGIHAMQPQVVITVPSTSPTYRGGLGQDPNWFGSVARYGDRWAKPCPDPITWSYSVAIQIFFRLPGVCWVTDYLQINIPITITAIGLALLPAKQQEAAQALKPLPLNTLKNSNPFDVYNNIQRINTQNIPQQPFQQQYEPFYGGGAPVMTQPMMRGNAVGPDPLQGINMMLGQQMNMIMQMQQMQINAGGMPPSGGQMQAIQFSTFSSHGQQPASGIQVMNFQQGHLPGMQMHQGAQAFQQPPHQPAQMQVHNLNQQAQNYNPATANYMGIPAVSQSTPGTGGYGVAPAVPQPHPQPQPQPQQHQAPPHQAYQQQPTTNVQGGYVSNQQYPPNGQPANSGGYGGYNNQNITSAGKDMYGFTGSTDWKLDHEVKEVLPSLRLCDISPSATDAFVIRDKEEDYTVTDDSALTFKPVFYMSPPRRNN